MLRAIPAAASFTFETHEVFADAIASLSNLDTARITCAEWYYTHAQDSVKFFELYPKQAFSRDNARKYAAGALSVLHHINH